jgi:hypothetical protein
MSSNNPTPAGIERQREYIARQLAAGDDGSLIVGAAFVNGIRDLGYRSTATALDELIDNSMQAAASKIDLAFGFDGATTDKKPTAVAVIDNGFGMIPDMLAFAAKWGGTDRENDRRGFGRYGYGLPSSCVSQGERFRIFSRTQGAELHEVVVDLQEIRQGRGAEGTRVLAPIPVESTLPVWVQDHVDKHFGGLPHGTVIIIDKLDRLSWVTRDKLKAMLLQHAGLIYRNYLREITITIDGTKVEPIDPLFLSELGRYFDLDSDRAEGIEEYRIDAKGHDGNVQGWIKVRVSYLPPTFGYKDKTLATTSKNDRMKVMDEHEGIIVMRNGRQIDVINRAQWTKNSRTFRNEDRYWQVEVDFSADLDEEFSVTTSKQSVRLSARVWDLLEKAGLDKRINELSTRRKVDFDVVRNAAEKRPDEKKPSELAMESAAKYAATKPQPGDVERLEKSKEAVEAEAERKAEEVGVPVEAVLEKLFKDIDDRPYAIITKEVPEGPFYRPELYGGQRRVILNTDHPFYTEVYASPNSTPEVRSALEVLLFVLADAELDARDERENFYKAERQHWSQKLKHALRELARIVPEIDRSDGKDELITSPA